MKRIFLFLFAAALLASCEKETILPEHNLPGEIVTFVNTHFPENPVVQAVKEKDDFELSYKVILNGGFVLEFNRKKEITDIDGGTRLPDSVVPSSILSYVATHFPDQYIVGWERDSRTQHVKLVSGIELDFSMNGEFLRIDN